MMGKSQYNIEILCKKYLNRSISEEEMEQMLDYFKDYGIPKEFEQALQQEFSKSVEGNLSEDILDMTDQARLNLKNHIASKNRPVIYRWIPYAAAILITAMVGYSWFLFHQRPSTDDQIATVTEINPGGNKATMILADGRVVTLDDSHDGIIMDEQDITYNDGTSRIIELETWSTPQLITLTTPRGGTYKVTLSDGTVVWLNAETTLKYPSHFNEEERVVQLDGEAYFEVKRISKGTSGHDLQPFKVVSANQTIAVLGTEFNVSAYADESETKTTLVEGKVRIESVQHRKNITLLPGEQGKIGQGGLEKNKVDVSDYIDWKNGEFVFRDETAKEVLHRIARWYDIDIDHSSYVPSGEIFSGSISRYSNLQMVLDIMQEAGDLAFEVKNRTVIVRNKLKK